MSSNVRRGAIPFRVASGRDDKVIDEVYTQGGFFGPWVNIYRRRNPGHPSLMSDDQLMWDGINANEMETSDLTDPEGAPMPLVRGDGVIVSVTRRSERGPFVEKDVDYHQIRFYHSGKATLETELGVIEVEPGDYVNIPQGFMFRETPIDGNFVAFVIQVDEPMITAEAIWDAAGFGPWQTDASLAVYPEPREWSDEEIDTPTRVRLFTDGEYKFIEYPFDPLRDVIGWVGDPVLFKANMWDTPGLGTSRSFLPPPSGLVLMSQSKKHLFNSMGPKPIPSASDPFDASFGPPCHFNDYDEVWFNHVSELAPASEGHMWFIPRAIPHPGLKGPVQFPPNPPTPMREMKVNFDTRVRLSWTPEALDFVRGDPHADIYTDLMAAHQSMVPGEALAFSEKNLAGHLSRPGR